MDELMPMTTNKIPLTPLGFLERAATVYGDCTSIIYNSVTYNWSETHRRCLQVASAIQSLGICKNDVVSVLAPNIPAMYELHFAVPMAGAVLNTINTRLDSRTISVLLRHSESKLIFVDHESSSLILHALSLFPLNSTWPTLILITDDQEHESPFHFFHSTYEDFVNKGRPDFEWVRPVNEWDPIVLNYTSGTTSFPKGVVHCHRGILVATINCLMDWAVPRQPVYLWTLPMFHANGWSLPWGVAAMGGVNVCLRKLNTASVFEAIHVHNVTHMCGAPVVLNMLTNSPDQKPLRNPVQFWTGGAPPPAAVLIRTEALGFVVSHAYGLTETAGVVATCAWNPNWNKLSAEKRARMKARQGVGMLISVVDVVDPETGKSVNRDGSTLGEVVIRGGSLMLGYLKDPVGTSKCMKDGWFYSGDIAVMDPDGYLSIKDRSKDVIISGGENVSSVEVESVLYTHPAVNEAAVVARPDEFWGETPCAFLSLKEGIKVGPSEKEVVEYCRERMPHFMAPKTVVFTAELPKTSTGKIKKFELKELAKAMAPGN